MQSERFEWDDEKAEENLRKHGVAFEAAAEAHDDPLAVTIDDPDHSDGEHREITVGMTIFRMLVVFVHTLRGERTRIIHARRAKRSERRRYMNETFDRIGDEGPDEMRPEYDFSKGVRGKYYNPRHSVTTLIRIDTDIADQFSSVEELNAALRTLIAERGAPGSPKE